MVDFTLNSFNRLKTQPPSTRLPFTHGLKRGTDVEMIGIDLDTEVAIDTTTIEMIGIDQEVDVEAMGIMATETKTTGTEKGTTIFHIDLLPRSV